jgi:hypothetical protein
MRVGTDNGFAKKVILCGLPALLSLLLSGCLIDSGAPVPTSTPALVPARFSPTAASGPTLVSGRVRYGCEDAWYLDPASGTPKISKSEAETRLRAFLEERGPHKAAELLEAHYGTWVRQINEDAPAKGGSPSPGATSTADRAVWLLVFRWSPQPGPEPTPPAGFQYRMHGIVDAQTGEALTGCAELMKLGTPPAGGTPSPSAITGVLETGQPTGPVTGPWLIFEERPGQLGRIDRIQPHKYEYDFKNEGGATLKITDVRITPAEPGGPTTGVTATVTQSTLEPGKGALLVITIDKPAAGMKGVVLHILSNDPAHPEIVIPIAFTVV